MDVKIESGWKAVLAPEFSKPYFEVLTNNVRGEYARNNPAIYPPGSKIFAAFDACAFSDVKVVIIGQDPYHGPGQANGLCFSVNPGVEMPPSLRNILKEVNEDVGAPYPQDGSLERWAKQGVFLLNSTLTVREHSPKSHSGLGWETFTDAVVRELSDKCENLVFMLWGSDAIRKGSGVDRSRHLVLTAPHPSPLSAYRGFFGCKHFSKANEYLKAHGKKTIQW